MDSSANVAGALEYHKRQAQFSNLVLLTFLLILVGFTLYRVIAEWSLAQQYQTVAVYRENMELAARLEREREGKTVELNFINGRDSAGIMFTTKTIMPRDTRRIQAGQRSVDSFDGGSSSLKSESVSSPNALADLLRKYSPFLKECRLISQADKVALTVTKPDDFQSKAMASGVNRKFT